MESDAGQPIAKVQCPRCGTRLDVLETQSGGRIIAVGILGPSVEHSAAALETFQRADAGPHIVCPACRHQFDPSGPYRAIPPLNPPRRG
jgi:DNA-directed RNA polymerase subunit RPC12/RpoP